MEFHETTTFKNIQYLGCSQLVHNNTDDEIKNLMKVLDEEQGTQAVEVSLLIPHKISSLVKLIDSRGITLLHFSPINIKLCIRGDVETCQSNCFGISLTHKSDLTDETRISNTIHQCHVFRAHNAETAAKALYSFSYAFSNKNLNIDEDKKKFRFESILQVKENDGSLVSPNWKLCPQHNGVYKVRRDREKKIIVQLKQTGGFLLNVKKCFGMLLAAGRNLRHSDLQLLEMEKNGSGIDSADYFIEANWDPRVHMFEVLNTETPRDTRVFMTVAVDIIIREVSEPVRFTMEAMARVFHEHERFYITPQTVVSEDFLLLLEKPSENGDSHDSKFTYISLQSGSERKRSKSNVGKSPSRMPTQLLHPTGEDESDCDEPLLSGSGKVLQEYGEEFLKAWNELIENWADGVDRTDIISELILEGVPDQLRGQIWQLLAKATDCTELVDKYNILINEPCPSEQVIMRDIHRTFPAHDYFKDAGGKGQQSLYKISKAYSLFDEEVSYCQGLSFLAASLLLHMTEDQSFCTLVNIMYNYGLRDLFKLGFDNLHLRFFQLTNLLKDYIPDLSNHLEAIGIETHMYASQWFLTLFTAKFPLQMVFFILDIFLSQGMNTIFHISLALLHDAKTDLLQLDFEGTLKYFRVSLPRKYRTENATKCLINKAVKYKLNHKKLEMYEKQYKAMKETEKISEDPLLRLEKEIGRHLANTLRLERENDDLAHELVTSKIELRKKLDVSEDQLESYANMIEKLTRQNEDTIEENKNLLREYEQIKEMYRRDVLRLEESGMRSEKLLAEYKKLFSEKSKRAEIERELFENQKKAIITKISDCDKCFVAVSEWEKNVFPTNSSPGCDLLTKLEEREDHIKSLEIDLAQTKLSLVEAECRNQDLTHQLLSQNESDGKKWFKKTITHLKEVGSSLKQHEEYIIMLHQDVVQLCNLQLLDNDDSRSRSSNSSSLESQNSLTNHQGSEKEEEESESTSCSENSFETSSTFSSREDVTELDTQFRIPSRMSTRKSETLSSSSINCESCTRITNVCTPFSNKARSVLVNPRAEATNEIRVHVCEQIDKLDTRLPEFNFEMLENKLSISAKERENIKERIRTRQLSSHIFTQSDEVIARTAVFSEIKSCCRVTDYSNLKFCFVNQLEQDFSEEPDDFESDYPNNGNLPFYHSKRTFYRSSKVQKLLLKLDTDNSISEAEQNEILHNEANLVMFTAKEKAKSALEEYRKERLKTCDMPRQARQYLSKTKVADIYDVKMRMKKAIDRKNMELVRLLLEKDNLHMEHDSLKLDMDDFTRRKFPLVFLDLKKLLKLQKSTVHNMVRLENVQL